MTDLRIVVSTYAGLEQVLADEIRAQGGRDIEIHNRAVSCTGDKGFMYKANFSLRTALRVMFNVSAFPIKDADSLYKGVYEIDWPSYFRGDQTFAVRCILNSELFDNNLFPALKAKDAIADRFRKATGKRPDVSREEPDFEVQLFIFRNTCQVLINSSGASLHLRGYRTEVDKAPLSEVLAAGIILLSGWEPHIPLIDFMCGSGTIPIEAALIAGRIPPGTFRKRYAFEQWLDFDEALYKTIREKQLDKIVDQEARIYGNELNKWVYRKACENVESAGVEDMVRLSCGDFRDFDSGEKRGTIIINPPYGEKLALEEVEAFYASIGERLKHGYAGFQAWILTGSPEGAAAIGLRPHRRIKVFNGPIECRLLGFELFKGKRNERFDTQAGTDTNG
jgi:putative N6-adenine-specific DNA methylase